MAKTKFRPLHDRVVVKRIDAEEKTKGGIIIPDSAKEKPSQGEITAVGPGGRDEAGKLIPIDLKVGDRVLFGKWSGTEVKLDGEELLIMKESRHHGRAELRQRRCRIPSPLCEKVARTRAGSRGLYPRDSPSPVTMDSPGHTLPASGRG